MYPLPKTPLPSTLGFVPRPTPPPPFQPIAPDTSSKTVTTHHTNNPQSVETSPGSSIPCGQQTPRGSTSTNSTPSQHTPPQSVVPPQPATSWSPNPTNTPTHTQSNRTSQPPPPTQLKQQSPIGTNTNPTTQPSIPAAETHQSVSSSPLQHIPKSMNGAGVKSSKTTTGKEQLYKIQEVLRHPSQYWDRLKPEDRPATGEYAKSFNKFRPKKVEVNEATVEEAIKFGQYLKRSKEDIAEAIDIYKSLGNNTFYGPEEESSAEHQVQQDQ